MDKSEIEITPEMIDAGSAALEHRLWLIDPDAPPVGKYSRAILVKEIFEAMSSAKARR